MYYIKISDLDRANAYSWMYRWHSDSAFGPIDNGDGHPRIRVDRPCDVMEAELDILDVYLPFREHPVGEVWKAVKDRPSFVWLQLSASKQLLERMYCKGEFLEEPQEDTEKPIRKWFFTTVV